MPMPPDVESYLRSLAHRFNEPDLREVANEIKRLTAEVERVKDASLNDIERLMSRVENLKHVLAALIVRLDMVTEDTAGIWGYLADHNMEYSGANYGKELEAARRALDGEE